MFLNKVVLGKVHNVSAFGAVTSCPRGCQSVSFKSLGSDVAWFELLVGMYRLCLTETTVH